VKEKLSVTLDAALVKFLDRLPGGNRSAKLERIERRFKNVADDLALRRALARAKRPDAERDEREAWLRTMEHDQWSESDEATSGPSSS
jgi:uncharacterized protein HemY